MQMLKAFFEDDNTHILPRGAAAVKLTEKTYFFLFSSFKQNSSSKDRQKFIEERGTTG